MSHVRALPVLDRTRRLLEAHLPTAKFWSDQEITGGKWAPTILENLDKATALVLIATPGVLSSIYAGFELGFVDKRLGMSKVFVLKAGATANQITTRPPLNEFQHYDAEDTGRLRDFLTKLAQESEATDFRSPTDEELQTAVEEFRSVIEAELRKSETTVQIGTPRILDVSQLAVPTVPPTAENLARTAVDIGQLEASLDSLEERLSNGDKAGIHVFFESATRQHKALTAKGGSRRKFAGQIRESERAPRQAHQRHPGGVVEYNQTIKLPRVCDATLDWAAG